MIIDKTRLFSLLQMQTACKRQGAGLSFDNAYALWQEITPYREAEGIPVTAEQVAEMDAEMKRETGRFRDLMKRIAEGEEIDE